MLYLKRVYILLPILASLSYVFANDLSDYEVKQLCSDKDMEILAYPGEPNKFIVCFNNKAQIGVCRSEPDPSDPQQNIQTCFDERKQSCSLDYCEASRPQTDYEKFVEKFCKDDDKWLARLPAEDCEHYYICLGSSNAPLQQSCPNGMHYSRVTEQCESPMEASCQSLDNMCKGKSTGYRFPSTNCYDYYECRLAKPTSSSCPYGQHFDASSKNCISAQSSECIEQTIRLPKCTIDDDGVYFKHSKCNRFYVCFNTVPLEAQCPQEFFFDEKNQLCRKDTTGVCRD